MILLALLRWWLDDLDVVLTDGQAAELRALVSSRDVPAVVATRARIVLWMAEGRRRKDVAEWAGVSLPTVDRWVDRYAADGLAGLDDLSRAAPRAQVPAWGSGADPGADPHHTAGADGGCRTGLADRWPATSGAPRACRCLGTR